MGAALARAIRRALWSGRLGRLCTVCLAIVLLFALLAPALSSWGADQVDWDALEAPPDTHHWFGTDLVGRDLLVRTATGARVSLAIAVIATTVSMLLGIPWGAAAGFLGGQTDNLMMRFVDVLYALPFVLVVILLVVVFGRSPYLLFLGLGAVYWLDLARIVRGQTLSVKQQAFVEAARAMGATTPQILRRHVLPNVAGPTLVYVTLTVPGVILAESFISFLGLGVQEPDTSLGVLIADGAQTMESAPWALLFPAAVLAVTVWCTSMLGDRLRDELDPRAVGLRPGRSRGDTHGPGPRYNPRSSRTTRESAS